jgi:hypothetical protein
MLDEGRRPIGIGVPGAPLRQRAAFSRQPRGQIRIVEQAQEVPAQLAGVFGIVEDQCVAMVLD